MTKRPSKYIGTLYAFKFEGREGYGICTNEVIDGWGPRLGQLIQFFEGTVPEGTRSVPDPATAPIMFSAFVDLRRFLRLGHVERLTDCGVPDHMQGPPRLRQGGLRMAHWPEPEPFFLTEGLGDGQVVVEDPVSEAEMATTPDLVVLDILGVRDCFRYGLTPERNYAIAYGTHVFDPERDALF